MATATFSLEPFPVVFVPCSPLQKMFTFEAVDGSSLYMGEDKFENEDLIKYGWPEDFWFHVDNLSSAHVCEWRTERAQPQLRSTNPPYHPAHAFLPQLHPTPDVRLRRKDAASARDSGYTLDDLSEECIRDCAQLVKANSIEGAWVLGDAAVIPTFPATSSPETHTHPPTPLHPQAARKRR